MIYLLKCVCVCVFFSSFDCGSFVWTYLLCLTTTPLAFDLKHAKSVTGKSFHNMVLQTFYQLSSLNVFVASKC